MADQSWITIRGNEIYYNHEELTSFKLFLVKRTNFRYLIIFNINNCTRNYKFNTNGLIEP